MRKRRHGTPQDVKNYLQTPYATSPWRITPMEHPSKGNSSSTGVKSKNDVVDFLQDVKNYLQTPLCDVPLANNSQWNIHQRETRVLRLILLER
ncbi:hypothetical protein CEXT_60261 [Caerostris extrusa]|uniref:Uncharacterized protein n=1 Tax=Caerostris extrusa TaxID=172846 RepID=A0AAV4PJD3_CAEEX|nr:hypothetical protein CEXT_60261 [Caerostris extrusa]